MSYNRYVGRLCHICGHRQNTRVDGTLMKHPVANGDNTVCAGSYQYPETTKVEKQMGTVKDVISSFRRHFDHA